MDTNPGRSSFSNDRLLYDEMLRIGIWPLVHRTGHLKLLYISRGVHRLWCTIQSLFLWWIGCTTFIGIPSYPLTLAPREPTRPLLGKTIVTGILWNRVKYLLPERNIKTKISQDLCLSAKLLPTQAVTKYNMNITELNYYSRNISCIFLPNTQHELCM